MVELETEWHPSTKLNVIAGELDFTVVDPIPDGVTRDEIEEHCYALRTLYGEYVDEIVAETTLSQREAQTWVLTRLVHEGADRLSYEAVGLYIWAIGRSTDGDPLSRTIVTDYADRAAEKVHRAEETVKRTGPPPYPDDCYEEPALVWVEGAVADRLRRRAGPEETYGDLLERLLDETLASIPMADLVAAYREAAGSEYVAIETVYRNWDEHLRIVAHAPGDVTVETVAEADAVTVDGTPIPFRVEERAEPRREQSHLAVYDATEGIDPEIGSDRLRDALVAVEGTLPEVVDRVRDAGGHALAVATEPAGAGAHLHPIFPDTGETNLPEDGGLAQLERIDLDDRTLAVGRISPTTADEYRTLTAETTLLWAAPDFESGPVELPNDPVERRERFPATVLRTA
ncbi:hypothetical protein [Halopenitus sp. POP-27]|uniref:hypothetical protein n=1 Tax=Halopenitus sp. POP-27 TaxID=2994425 RepID=UPI0024698B86|nr:hypothetical protein [Halopenitus sp. POP-27]